MTAFCTHYACRCDRALELALQADRTGNQSFLRMALAAHDESVPCRLPTPLPLLDAPGQVRDLFE